ncbi:hypothetical protein C8R47DRAFT_1102420 [Mycena vitilis]|nr:hypothetical protein C8R47DRAFT_1102420 [Mycena vitilis]
MAGALLTSPLLLSPSHNSSPSMKNPRPPVRMINSTVQTDRTEVDTSSYCTRRGCAHICKCGGPRPLDELATHPQQRAASCVAAEVSATQDCAKDWWPSQAVIELFLNPPDDPALFRNFGQCAPPLVEICGRCGEDHPESNACEAELRALEKLTAKNARAPVKRNAARKKPKPKPRSGLVFTPNATAMNRKKKGARTEAQRRALLLADPWTHEVGPHHVVCGGCSHTISLDKRSRYYPGLWEKHRLRCVAKKASGSVDGDSASVKADTPSVTPEPDMEHSFQAMPPVDMAPRTSYYRDRTV